MSFFITGGASQTGTIVAELLKKAGKEVVFGSRSGSVPDGFDSVKFDWEDPSNFQEVFASGRTFQGVYILGPMGLFDFSANMIAFIDLAVEKGVKRFVLMSGSMSDKAGSEYGIPKVHRYLEEKGLDHFVPKPTIFMEAMPPMFARTITENQEIRTCLPNAKIPFIAVEDIAKFVVDAFLAEKIEVTTRHIIGPQSLTYDQVAEVLSEVLDKKITHKLMTPEEAIELYAGLPELGWPRPFAEAIVMMNPYIDSGSQEQLAEFPDTLVGPLGFKRWAERVKEKFQV